MSRSNQEYKEIIDIIFKQRYNYIYSRLSNWIVDRLKGKDKQFSIRNGEERQKFKLISEIYHTIDEINFRYNFKLVIKRLLLELWNFSQNKNSIVENKEYIYEIISLSDRIPEEIDFTHKSTFYDYAIKGNFLGIKAFDDDEETDLHRLMLNALSNERTPGDSRFWNHQIKKYKEVKWIVITPFYTLVDRNYMLELVLDIEPFGIFIETLKEDKKELESCIEALFNGYGRKEILCHLKKIDEKLTIDQRAAIKSVLKNFSL